MALATLLHVGVTLFVKIILFRPLNYRERRAPTRLRDQQLDPANHVIRPRDCCITSHFVHRNQGKRARTQREGDSGAGAPGTGPPAQVEVLCCRNRP